MIKLRKSLKKFSIKLLNKMGKEMNNLCTRQIKAAGSLNNCQHKFSCFSVQQAFERGNSCVPRFILNCYKQNDKSMARRKLACYVF